MEASLDDVETFVEADTAFHVERTRATGNRALVLLIQALTALTQKERVFMLDVHREELRAAVDSHRPLLASVEAGDAAATREHLSRVGERLVSLGIAPA